ncbi:MAG: hypothetical protein WBM28_04430 [Burkholderiales bacterium]
MNAVVFLERLVGDRDLFAAFLGDFPGGGVGRKSIRVPLSDETPVARAQRFPVGFGSRSEGGVAVRIVIHGGDSRARLRGVALVCRNYCKFSASAAGESSVTRIFYGKIAAAIRRRFESAQLALAAMTVVRRAEGGGGFQRGEATGLLGG